MKYRFSHINGQYNLKTDSILCEVYGTPTTENYIDLFTQGWLPTVNNEWYQARSSRVKNQKLLYDIRTPIIVSQDGDYRAILDKCKKTYDNLNVEHIEWCIERPGTDIWYFNGTVMAAVNWFDFTPYISVLLGNKFDRGKIKQYIVPMIRSSISNYNIRVHVPYIYIGEWYKQFDYKKDYDGFEWWDGEKWQ